MSMTYFVLKSSLHSGNDIGTESLAELLNAVTQRIGKEASHILVI